MTTLQELRQQFANRLDQWEAQANAMRAQLGSTLEGAMSRLDDRKRQLGQVLAQLRSKLEREKSLVASRKETIIGRIEHLRVQLALGKAETRDAYDIQRQRISTAIAELEQDLGDLEEGVARRLRALMQDLVHGINGLDAEFDAAGIHYHRTMTELRARFEEGRWALNDELASLQRHLADARRRDGGAGTILEQKLASAMQQVRDLFHGTHSDGNGATGAGTDVTQREQMIREAAYFRAAQRGFAESDPTADWLAAEAEIDAMLAGNPAASAKQPSGRHVRH